MIDVNSQFFAILTNVGMAKQANADALGIPWKITEMGVVAGGKAGGPSRRAARFSEDGPKASVWIRASGTSSSRKPSWSVWMNGEGPHSE